uniref:PAS domain-containing protein n=1 Tax=Timema monikensis TaxID=170555 RepID=A0A7R9E5Y3_9NEOP|nr:unnamed protein product [Timema monikensis]
MAQFQSLSSDSQVAPSLSDIQATHQALEQLQSLSSDSQVAPTLSDIQTTRQELEQFHSLSSNSQVASPLSDIQATHQALEQFQSLSSDSQVAPSLSDIQANRQALGQLQSLSSDSQEDLLIHGDSVYDIIDKQDHQAIQAELVRNSTTPGDDERMFLCRMNVSRNARRQMRFGDQKVVLVQGHYLSFLPLCSRNEPVFLATCTPVAMPETRECVVQGATNVFTSIHSMDMKFMHIDKNGEFHLGYPRSELQGASWYHLLHWDCMREAQSKHRLITQSEQDRSCILLLRLQRRSGDWLWIHCVLQVKDNMENSQQPVIVCTNQVLRRGMSLWQYASGNNGPLVIYLRVVPGRKVRREEKGEREIFFSSKMAPKTVFSWTNLHPKLKVVITMLVNALVVLSSTAEDGEIEVRISVGGTGSGFS